ncbi:hypothetical protein MTTB_13480 [Methanothermobacter tenebrarum]|uniref:Uncharacterized protein n=1 Tax=Methanothermobacter tenebrarum TaxID=680118 RepID=A0ABN6PEL6_9EURY|nr:hypothetical protein MTTB_13480 [Methanothermobacter tenebrarum]
MDYKPPTHRVRMIDTTIHTPLKSSLPITPNRQKETLK